MMNRARIRISLELLKQVLQWPEDCEILFLVPPIEPFGTGAKVADIIVASPEFKENAEGEMLPLLDAQYRSDIAHGSKATFVRFA